MSDPVTAASRWITALSRPIKRLILLGVDLVSIPLAFWIALALDVNGVPDERTLAPLWLLAATLTALGGAMSIAIGLPKVKLNAFESRAMQRSTVMALALGLCGYALASRLIVPPVSGAVFITFALVLSVLSILVRLALRRLLIWLYQRGQLRARVLIYGAGQTGVQLAHALRTDPAVEAVAFVDDNPMMTNMLVAGLPVHSPTRIMDLVRRKSIGRVILAMPSLSQPKLARLARNLRTLGCEIQTIPSFAQLLAHGVPPAPRRLVADAFLNRSGLNDEIPGVSDTYAGRRVMVTGGGGSIGAELCRQVLLCRPAALVILEVSEAALYEIERELAGMARAMAEAGGQGAVPEIVPVLGTVIDARAVTAALEAHRVEIVLHAAAYKHVPMLERNVVAGLENNVLGTHVVAEAARRAGVARFILVSTDKAVRPVGVLGASKRLAELVVQDLASRGGNTRFSMVRFGNVLGSSGSVVPLFEEQIARGGPVTLTDEGVTRYFMTVSEAARLVLMAGSFTRGGDVFVLDMGDPVPIRRLARQMIEGAGYAVRDAANPDGDIEIVVTGLRPGEKLYEELLIGTDMLPTPHPKILRAQEGRLSELEVRGALKALRAAVEAADPAAARAVIARWVDGYRPAGEGGAAAREAAPAAADAGH